MARVITYYCSPAVFIVPINTTAVIGVDVIVVDVIDVDVYVAVDVVFVVLLV